MKKFGLPEETSAGHRGNAAGNHPFAVQVLLDGFHDFDRFIGDFPMRAHTHARKFCLLNAPVGLVLLGLIPALAGASRLFEIGRGAVTEENSRFLAAPLPISIHILCATLFSLLGAFQFSSSNSAARLRWHRWTGMILLPCGFAMAGTGVWMTLYFPATGYDGVSLYWLRLVVGIGMTFFLLSSVIAIFRRDFLSHRDWIVRAYALALGAGTQVITHVPWILLASWHCEIFRTLSMAAGWGINVFAAELLIVKWRRSEGRSAGVFRTKFSFLKSRSAARH